jgi:hypothetical protein
MAYKSIILISILPILILILSGCSLTDNTNKNGNVGISKSNIQKNMRDIRQSAVAGRFYPAEAEKIKEQINSFLGRADTPAVTGRIRALMVPHAGYEFSGPTAAYAYKHLQGAKIKRVYLLGNSHSSFFEGVAIDDSSAWLTPLGLVDIDQDMAGKLEEAGAGISFNREAHQKEHSLEVQLPFLQTVLKTDFKIVPILFGNSSGGEEIEQAANVLAENLDADDLVIISSDMSHFPPYEEANRVDKETLDKIASGDVEELEEHIAATMEKNIPGEDTLLCGEDAVKAGMYMAGITGWDNIQKLHYSNSGDNPAVDKESVVGYGAMAFSDTKMKKQQEETEEHSSASAEKERSEDLLDEKQRQILLDIARETVEKYIRIGEKPEYNIADERLQRSEGAFVTLKKDGNLRGCIGQIVQTEKPLWQVIRDVAMDAALHDDRFPPVEEKELPELNYEVSVLSVPEPVNDWREVRPGKHGVIIKKGSSSGVFLPQVAEETGWDREEFLGQLCLQKLGLPPQTYKNPDAEIYVFTAEVFGEN